MKDLRQPQPAFSAAGLIALLVFCSSILSGCQGAAAPDNAAPTVSTPMTSPPGAATEEVIVDTPLVNITGVTVESGEKLTFRGRTSVSEGECLYSQLFRDGALVEWWPAGKCFPVTGMDWCFSVPLGEEGAPENLDPDVEYTLRVWWPGEPDIASNMFSFDLSTPPQPQE